MNKKFLSIIITLIMMLSTFSVFAAEVSEDITVYLTLSKYGEFVEDKDGEKIILREITLTGKDEYTVDDVFTTAHTLYYPDGADGYASSIIEDLGLGVDKLWGDTSYNFGYMVDNVSVNGVGVGIENGECIDAFIYKNTFPHTEGYAYFDKYTAKRFSDGTLGLTLTYSTGYDDSYNPLYSPCDGATITLNGEETEFVTDENGEVRISFENTGEFIISAKKSKLVTVLEGEDATEVEMSAITAPVCVVDIKSKPEIDDVIHNIAKYYSEINFEEVGGNLPWIVADMLVYEEIFSESENVLTEERKEEAMKMLVSFADKATMPGDLAKSIIAIRALGYDAKNVYTENFKKVDIVKKLTDLIDSNSEDVTSVYAVPYVIIALSQYDTDERTTKLINSVKASKSLWQSVAYGTDAMTPIILALSPYYNEDGEIEALVNETLEILKSEQREDGLIDGFKGYESASTGLAICALSSIGVDSDNVKKTDMDANLIDGLLLTANESLNGFPNAFATEQGFRGLLAWKLLNNKSMYDFSDYPLKDANASWAEKCPVVFKVTPDMATVTVTGATEKSKNGFDLDQGTYSYTVSASGYITKTDTVEVTSEDVEKRTLKTVTVALTEEYHGGGSGSGSVYIKPVEEEKEKEQETETVIETPVFSEKTFSDVKADDWYYSSVKYVYENELFKGTGNGFIPGGKMTRAMLVTVLHRLAKPEKSATANVFSDVSKDSWYAESVKWAVESGIVNGVSHEEFAPDNDITREQLATIIYRYAKSNGYDMHENSKSDVYSYKDSDEISDYASDAVSYVMKAGIMNGRGEKMFAPKAKITRAEVAAVIMRFSEVKNDSEK